MGVLPQSVPPASRLGGQGLLLKLGNPFAIHDMVAGTVMLSVKAGQVHSVNEFFI
jgi:hypothetical protein